MPPTDRAAASAADAQVATYTRLQAALDVTAAKNSQLAQSYRAIYAEAAKAAERAESADAQARSIEAVVAKLKAEVTP